MFVVVFLIEPKVHVIVPEQFIFDLNEESLKNVGKNGNFHYKIFWSENALTVDGAPDSGYKPNFDSPESKVFPPIGSACYVGKLKKFCSEYLVRKKDSTLLIF